MRPLPSVTIPLAPPRVATGTERASRRYQQKAGRLWYSGEVRRSERGDRVTASLTGKVCHAGEDLQIGSAVAQIR